MFAAGFPYPAALTFGTLYAFDLGSRASVVAENNCLNGGRFARTTPTADAAKSLPSGVA